MRARLLVTMTAMQAKKEIRRQRKVEDGPSPVLDGYEVPAEAKNWWWKSIMIDAASPDFPRACSLFTLEGNQLAVFILQPLTFVDDGLKQLA